MENNPQLSPYESSEPALLEMLRRRLRDDDYMIRAFTLAVTDSRARSVCAEIRNGQLRITSRGGGLGNVTVDLAGIETDTIGGLVDHLRRSYGNYIALSPNEEMNTDHPSTDLRVKGNGNIQGEGVHFYHRRWSDEELRDLLDHSARRHNMNYKITSVPQDEHIFVVTLSLAEACRVMSQDGVKRRGLSFEVQDCLSMAESYEQQYLDDRRRQDRAVPVAKIKDTSVEGGNIVQGTFFRRNMRTGYMSPYASQGAPECPELFVSAEEDIQDVEVRIHWRRVRDTDFRAMELWRDTVPDVRRAYQGDLTTTPQSPAVCPSFPTTSKLVFSPRWANSHHAHSSLSSYGIANGQAVNSFVDGANRQREGFAVSPWDAPPPEPETTYYYVLYVFDINHEVVGSNVVCVTTKRLRARFSRDAAVTALTPVTGPLAGGTACTIRGERFHEGMRVRLGDKQVENLTIVSAEEATFDTPALYNERAVDVSAYDLIITSDHGLQDALLSSWTYTA